MNKALYDMIFKRKSFHLFRNVGNESISKAELDEILEEYKTFEPLCKNIKTSIKIVPSSDTTCKRGQEYCILMFSEKKDNYLANIGYLGEQLDLYLASKNIGALWFGIGKTDVRMDGMEFVIMIAVSKIDDELKFRKDMFKSKRKLTQEIWTGETIDGVTDIAKFAPSACNTQPWLVENDGKKLSVYRYKKPGKRGIMPAAKVAYYNRIDIGIYLCFLELCMLQKGINFSRNVYVDGAGDDEKTLLADYYLNCSK